MSGLIQNLLTDVATGFFGNAYLRDYTHASKTFRTGSYGYAPKFKHLFHVYFEINTDIVNSARFSNVAEDKNFGLAVKTVQLPKYSFDLHTMNQYNRKRIVQTKIKYDPISITFHDDNSDLIRKLWHSYYTYYYQDAATPDTTPGVTNSVRDIYDPKTTQGHDWGYIGEGSAPSPTGSNKPAFFKAINIYGFNQHKFSLYTYINPVIESFGHDTYSYAESGTMENSMSIQYETVKYYQGDLNGKSPGEIVKQFGDVAHYDRTLSPIARPGSNATILGPNGLLSSAGGILDDLATNPLRALQTAGTLVNTFKNPKGLLDAAKSDALGVARNALTGPVSLGTATRNIPFDFPGVASSAIATVNAKVGNVYKGLTTPPTAR